jgi:two-component system chemotaxis sensor kinase CheA
MSVDMSEFYQVFFEEAGELLAQMEQLLLNTDVSHPDPEDLNAIFRCAHSIKGGAATFGFTDVAEVTHALESLLDQIRKGEKSLRPEMVDTFLAAGDVLKDQLAGHRGDGQADAAEAAAVCARLKVMVTEQDAPAQEPAASAAPPAPEGGGHCPAMPGVSAPQAGANPRNRYAIEFEIDGAPESTGSLARHVIGGLESLGRLAFSRGGRDGGAPATDGGGTRQMFACTLETAAPEADVWEVLAFNLDPARVRVAAAAGPDQAAADAGAAQPSESADHGFFTDLYEAVVAPSAVPAEPAAAPVPPQAAPEAQETASRSQGRRASDDPNLSVMRAGRREGDKLAVSAAAGADAASIRVNIEKVDHLINLVGELVIAQAMLAQTVSRVDPVTGEALMQSMAQLEHNTRDLQDAVMSIRMLPIGFVFSRFPRLVRDLASKLGKYAELKTFGEGTELDKSLIEKITDPLTHLVRNSLDHGIETPERRRAAGKPERGTITLRAFHQGGAIVIEVSDDGAGLNRGRILEKARERGIAVHDAMADSEVWQLIFDAGFSTAERITDVSGRGVGMDVVKRNIHALGGSIEIASKADEGTRISIRVPLTLAILDGMSVAVGGETFIVPLTAISESLRPRREDVKTVQGRGRVVQVRGEYLPIIALHELFGIQSRAADIEQAVLVILEAEGARKAVLVDELLGQHQVVIKSLETNYRKINGISGATIMGDGRVALILDVAAVVRSEREQLRAAA